jgi:hypothetical protein
MLLWLLGILCGRTAGYSFNNTGDGPWSKLMMVDPLLCRPILREEIAVPGLNRAKALIRSSAEQVFGIMLGPRSDEHHATLTDGGCTISICVQGKDAKNGAEQPGEFYGSTRSPEGRAHTLKYIARAVAGLEHSGAR